MFACLYSFDSEITVAPVIKWYLSKQVVGYDFSGIVIHVDPESEEGSNLKVGDEVFGSTYGTLSQYINVSEHELTHIPQNMYLKHSCGLCFPLISTFEFLRHKINIIPQKMDKLTKFYLNRSLRVSLKLKNSPLFTEGAELKYSIRIQDIKYLLEQEALEMKKNVIFNDLKSDNLENEIKTIKKDYYDEKSRLNATNQLKAKFSNVIVIGASGTFGSMAVQMLNNMCYVTHTIGISSQEKKEFCLSVGCSSYYAYEDYSLYDVLTDLSNKGIQIQYIFDFATKTGDKLETNLFDANRFYNSGYDKVYFRFSNPKDLKLSQFIHSEEFMRFPKPFHISREALNLTKVMVELGYVVPIYSKEFEFQLHEVERAFKWLSNRNRIGNAIIKVGEINETSIYHEELFINRLKEKRNLTNIKRDNKNVKKKN